MMMLMMMMMMMMAVVVVVVIVVVVIIHPSGIFKSSGQTRSLRLPSATRRTHMAYLAGCAIMRIL